MLAENQKQWIAPNLRGNTPADHKITVSEKKILHRLTDKEVKLIISAR